MRVAETNIADRVFRGVTAAIATLVVATLLAIAVTVAFDAWPSVARFGPRFAIEQVWDPAHDVFGALTFVYGTLVSSLVALVIAVPLALGAAITMAELAPPWLREPLGFLVELLAAVPSVVYGLWGIFVLAPWLRDVVQPALGATLGFLPLFSGPQRGFGMLAGGIILAIMILPTIASVSREVLRAVPNTMREGSLALGATRWETVVRIVLPCARSGIVGAIILGLGRALGETMAVTMVIGNRPEISASLFAPAYTMASVLANEFSEATGKLHVSALTEVAALLFVITLLLNIVARLLVWRVARVPAGNMGT
ncbi:MAG: phosphate ABC transporter permease subunit PstC [Myxococcota bacterium]